MDEEIILLKELKEAREKNRQRFNNAPLNMDFNEFNSYMKETGEVLEEASRKYRMVQTPTYDEISEYGDLMSLSSFIEATKDGFFTDYDGSGNYIKDGKMSNISIYPSDIKYNAIRKDFTKIIWFNR